MKYRMQAPNVPTSTFQPRDYVSPALQSFQAGQKMGQQRAMNKAASRYLMSGGADQEAAQMLSQMNPDAYLKATQQIQAQQKDSQQAAMNKAVKQREAIKNVLGEVGRLDTFEASVPEFQQRVMSDPMMRNLFNDQELQQILGGYDEADYQIAQQLALGSAGKASAKTEILPGGITVQAMPSGEVIVKDKFGNVVEGEERAAAIEYSNKIAIQQAAGKAGAAEGAKQEEMTRAAQERKFQEKLGEQAGNLYSKLNTAAQEASMFIPKLENLRKMAEAADTGAYAELSMLGKYIGMDVSDQETLNAALMGLAQDILNQQTGTKTDFDFQVAVQQSASLGKSPEANVALINALINRQLGIVAMGDLAKQAYENGDAQAVLDLRYTPPKQDGKIDDSTRPSRR